MTELVYRDGRVEKLWSGYGLVSDGDVLHIGTSWGRSIAGAWPTLPRCELQSRTINSADWRSLLEDVASGRTPVDDALDAIELALICELCHSPLGEQADVCMSCFDESPPPGPAGKGPRSQELLARLRTLSSAGTAIEEKAI